MEETDNVRRHRIFYGRVPKSVPPFDSAFVCSGNKAGLKLLLAAAPENCSIAVFSDGTRAAYALSLLYKRKFKLHALSIEVICSDLSYTGRVIWLFTRGTSEFRLSPLFIRGDSMLHELSITKGDVIDMFCLGPNFHKIMVERNKPENRSLVFAEE